MNAVVHDFTERLEYSARLSDEGCWAAFYARLWPEMLASVRIDGDSRWQRWGVDRMILLPNGKQILIDEKKREPDKNGKSYDDFLCEEWSVFRNGKGEKVGWTLDARKQCDLIAYAITGLSKCYLLPTELLRLTAKEYLPEWKRVKWAYPKDSQNEGYWTRNCAVAWARLFADMRAVMSRQFGEKLQLPLPVTTDGLTLFDHCGVSA